MRKKTIKSSCTSRTRLVRSEHSYFSIYSIINHYYWRTECEGSTLQYTPLNGSNCIFPSFAAQNLLLFPQNNQNVFLALCLMNAVNNTKNIYVHTFWRLGIIKKKKHKNKHKSKTNIWSHFSSLSSDCLIK